MNMISKHNKPETKPTVFDEFVDTCEGDEQQFFSGCADFSVCGDFAVAVECMNLQSIVQLVTVMLSSSICNDCFSLTTWSTTLRAFGTDFNLVCMMLQNLIHVTNIS